MRDYDPIERNPTKMQSSDYRRTSKRPLVTKAPIMPQPSEAKPVQPSPLVSSQIMPPSRNSGINPGGMYDRLKPTGPILSEPRMEFLPYRGNAQQAPMGNGGINPSGMYKPQTPSPAGPPMRDWMPQFNGNVGGNPASGLAGGINMRDWGAGARRPPQQPFSPTTFPRQQMSPFQQQQGQMRSVMPPDYGQRNAMQQPQQQPLGQYGANQPQFDMNSLMSLLSRMGMGGQQGGGMGRRLF